MQKKTKSLQNISEVQPDKIRVFFKRSILQRILDLLIMKHDGFRTVKAVKNIYRLFCAIDQDKYKKDAEMLAMIWSIRYIAKQWLAGVVTIDLIFELAKRDPEFDGIKDKVISESIKSNTPVSAPEAKMLMQLIEENLQFGYIAAYKENYLELLDTNIDVNKPGELKKYTENLFKISKSLVDIQYNTNLVASELTFDTGDVSSVRAAVTKTVDSLSGSSSILKTGIIRLNTLLSPGYMNGRLYVYVGPPGSYKSGILLTSTLHIREFNPGYQAKTPGLKPVVLYVTMENTFTETIERMWAMNFDEPITNYSPEEAFDKLSDILGLGSSEEEEKKDEGSLENMLDANEEKNDKPNIDIIIKYFPYREISTDGLYTIIQDLKEDGKECVALVFDYIKRIRPAEQSSGDTTKTELAKIINELKALAVINDIPVITAHQVNRSGVAAMDQGVRLGKVDITKLSGREHVGDAYEIVETADWMAIINTEIQPGTNRRFLCINAVKRRRIDQAESEFKEYTYIAHPFRQNSLQVIPDMRTGKVMSVGSLQTGLDDVEAKTKNAVQREVIPVSEFEETL